MTDQMSIGTQKKKLKFVIRLDNEKHFKTKTQCPFRPTDET